MGAESGGGGGGGPGEGGPCRCDSLINLLGHCSHCPCVWSLLHIIIATTTTALCELQ